MKERKSTADYLFDVFNYTGFTLFALACIFPFYYIFINTISDNQLVSAGLITIIPRGLHFRNYLQVLKMSSIPRATLVSVARTVLGTTLTTLCTAWMGYAISRRELWHRKFVYRYFIVTMYLGAGLIPWFLTYLRLGLTNNFLAYIIGLVNAFNMILIKTYIESIPAVPGGIGGDRRGRVPDPVQPHRVPSCKTHSCYLRYLDGGGPLELLYGHLNSDAGFPALYPAVRAVDIPPRGGDPGQANGGRFAGRAGSFPDSDPHRG
jgi:hypothetical protein